MASIRWQERRRFARLLRAAVYLVPLSASIAAGFGLSRVWLRPSGSAGIAWWVAILGSSTVVLYLVDRAMRRLLPLAAMLELSMSFPDRLPSRFRLALKAGTPSRREGDLNRLAEQDPSLQEAAELSLSLVASLSAHDRKTRGHSERVRAFAELIGDELGLSRADLDKLRWSSLLHDIGKLTVPAEILNKEEPLTDEEWKTIRDHPLEGARVVAPLRPWLGEWLSSVDQHHEKWDGTGYPHGLAGEEITLAGRIVAVADAFEVMTSRRSYRAPVDPEEARQELVRSGASHFDPDVVRALLNISIGRLRRVVGPVSWLIQVPFLAGGVPGADVDASGADGGSGDAGLPPSHHPAGVHHPAASHHLAAQMHPAAQSPDGSSGDHDIDLQDHLRREEEQG